MWRSVLLVEETGVPGENHRPAASHWQTLSHNVVSSTACLTGIQTHNISGTDCIGSYKSNYICTIWLRPQRPLQYVNKTYASKAVNSFMYKYMLDMQFIINSCFNRCSQTVKRYRRNGSRSWSLWRCRG